jgi:hypothetical protein
MVVVLRFRCVTVIKFKFGRSVGEVRGGRQSRWIYDGDDLPNGLRVI